MKHVSLENSGQWNMVKSLWKKQRENFRGNTRTHKCVNIFKPCIGTLLPLFWQLFLLVLTSFLQPVKKDNVIETIPCTLRQRHFLYMKSQRRLLNIWNPPFYCLFGRASSYEGRYCRFNLPPSSPPPPPPSAHHCVNEIIYSVIWPEYFLHRRSCHRRYLLFYLRLVLYHRRSPPSAS